VVISQIRKGQTVSVWQRFGDRQLEGGEAGEEDTTTRARGGFYYLVDETPQVLLVQFSVDANIHGDPLPNVQSVCTGCATKTSHCVSVLCQERV